MAATSASRSWARRVLTTTAVTAVGLLALAIPASAHKPDASAACKDKVPTVTVSAVYYELKDGDETPNYIKIFVDGSDKPAKEFHFGRHFPEKDIPFGDLDATVEHTFKVDIKAWNAEFSDEKDSWSRHFPPMKTPACKEKDTPPPDNPPANPPANPPVNPAPQPQPAPAPAVSSGGLADTGVSIGVPLAIGGVLLVGGAGLLLLMRRRGKA